MTDAEVDRIQEASDAFFTALEGLGLKNVFIGWHVEDSQGETFSGSSRPEDMTFGEQAERLFLISGHLYLNMKDHD